MRLQQVPAAKTGEERQRHAQEAQQLLEQYLAKESSQAAGARLLLSASAWTLDKPGASLDETDLRTAETPELRLAAHLAFGTGRFAEADTLITAALERHDDRIEVLKTAILIRFELARDDDVLEHVDELMQLEPDDPRPLEAKGMVWENRGGHWEQAIAAYQQYLALQPEGAAHVRLRLARLLLTQGAKDEARQQLQQIAEEAPQLIEQNSVFVARLMLLDGNADQALQVADEQLAKQPADAEALLLKSQIVLAQENFQEAIDTLEATVRADPLHTEAHYLLGQALARSGDAARAKEQIARHRKVLDSKIELYKLERRASRDPSDTAVRLELARRYEELGLPDVAEFWRNSLEVGANPH